MSAGRRSARLFAAWSAAVWALCLATMCRAQLEGMLELEENPITYTFERSHVGIEYVMKCSVRILCQFCNPVIEFQRKNTENVFVPLTEENVWKVRYVKSCEKVGNVVACSQTIPSYSTDYDGTYRCVWWEYKNKTRFESYQYVLERGFSEQDDQAETQLTCILPQVENIMAVPLFEGDKTHGQAKLTWDVTVRDDDNLEPCKGGRNWKVRLSLYDGVYNIPDDFNPEEGATHSDWENVHGEDTHHILSYPITKDLYYLFEVGHRNDTLKPSNAVDYADEFASHVFYFGQQDAVRIDRSTANDITTITVGQSTEVKCVAEGVPHPTTFFSRGNFIPDASGATLTLDDVTEEDSGTYVCYASNIIVNPPTGKRIETDALGFRVNVEAKQSDPEGVYCEFLENDYTGNCKDFIHLELMYFTNSSTAGSREAVVGGIMTEIDEIIVNKRCRSLAYAMVCNTVYAPCHPQQKVTAPRAICPSACEVFASGECAGLIGPKHEAVYPYISQCNMSGNGGGELPECVPISIEAPRIDEFETIEDTGSCVRGNGRGFSGLQTVTQSGRSCQSWEQNYPQEHPMLPTIFRTDLKKPNSEHSCRNPGGIGERPWCYTQDVFTRWEYCDIPNCDWCEEYQGSMCAVLPGYNTTQRVLVRKDKTISGQDELERDMTHLIDSIKYRYSLTEGCEGFLITILCHSTFPFCQNGSDDQALQLCSDHCQLLHNLETFCPHAYRQYLQYRSAHGALVSNPQCDLVTADNSQCLSLPLPPVITSNSLQNSASADSSSNSLQNSTTTDTSTTVNCFVGQGTNYRGSASQTASGIPCLFWDSDKPRSDFITAENYPELEGAENYCRNPGSLLDSPWCYASYGPETVAECGILPCQQDQDVNAVPDGVAENDEQIPSSDNSVITTLSVFLVVVIVLLVGLATVALLLHFKQKSRKKQRQQVPFRVTNIMSEEKYCSNPDYTVQAPSAPSAMVVPDSFHHIDKENITYVSQLGQGNFGVVFKGKAVNMLDGEREVEVAVKTLKEEAGAEMVSSFIEEAKLMFSFDHPNILTIYGVCMDEFPYQMVFEYMDQGDLTQFLRSRASSTQRRMLYPFSSRTESNFSNDPPSLSKTQLLYVSEQIASGMAYLSAKHHVHRDLACRNCLIKKDLTVKIGDFGMSRNLYSRDYYRINGQAVLPVRWMSPEALIYGKFSVEGDVWSFGVVMWEIFSFALQPYYGISNEDVTEYIRKGRTLRRPDYCPMDVFKVMQECWNMEPNERPTFDELHKLLNDLHERASVSDDGKDETMSIDSDMPSDAFYSDGMSIDDDLA